MTIAQELIEVGANGDNKIKTSNTAFCASHFCKKKTNPPKSAQKLF